MKKVFNFLSVPLPLLSVLMTLAGVAKALRDTLAFHYSVSIFADWNPQYWNPSISWMNKYKDYQGGDLSEAFFLSKTWLVFATDGWHLADMLCFLIPIICIAISLLHKLESKDAVLNGIYSLIFYLIGFNVFYYFIFV